MSTLLVTEKRCAMCGQTKPLDEFHVNRKAPDGRQYHCKPCGVSHQRNHRAKNPERHRQYMRNWYYKSLYGISLPEYDILLIAQSGRCSICKEAVAEDDYLNVDHDHETGEVRGLLCSPCNRGLGFFRDDPERLAEASAYVRR